MPLPYQYSTNPPPCSHCGFCCLSTPCEVGISLGGFTPHSPCPALEWDDQPIPQSRCGLLANPDKHLDGIAQQYWSIIPPEDRLKIMDSGTGCSMKARVITPDGVVEFALMSNEAKIAAAEQAKARNVLIVDAKNGKVSRL